MALLKGKLLFDVARRGVSSGPVLQAAWNKDWKPGKFPKTDEEAKASAAKYGLLPQEYAPTPDDGYGAGDYPDFKPYSVESRDPTYPWDYPEYRRNYGEAMTADFNMYTEDRYDVNMRQRYSDLKMMLGFVGAMGGSFLLYWLTEDMCFLPKMPQHMPAPGVKHYTYPSTHSAH